MPSMKEIETWLTPSEAGAEIGISRQAMIKRLDNGGTFRAVRTHSGWLIAPESVEEFKREREMAAYSRGILHYGDIAETGAELDTHDDSAVVEAFRAARHFGWPWPPEPGHVVMDGVRDGDVAMRREEE